MPIKLPKGFARRKSSGNALEEVENLQDLAQPSSFKVFERPGGGRRSLDGVNMLKRMSQGRPLSSPGTLDEDDLFADVRNNQPNNRGSGGTDNSASTGVLYDSSASSARFSSSSTLPSSTDIPTHGDNSFSLKRALQEIPVPPIPESLPVSSLRAKAGRTFSFGTKSPKSSPMGSSRPGTGQLESPTIKPVNRERAMTASTTSTTSTTTPPKLLDSDVSFDSGPEGFSNMFNNYDNRRTPPLETQGLISRNSSSPNFASSPLPPLPPKHNFYDRPSLVPSPINVDRTRPVEPSPYSWGSQDSHEGLMNSSSPALVLSPQELPSIPRKSFPVSKSMPIPETASPTAQSKPDRPGFGLRRSSAYGGKRRSTPIEDENARLVQDSVSYSKKSFGPPPAFGRNPSPQIEIQKAPVALVDRDNGDLTGTSAWRDEPSGRTPKPRKPVPYRESESPTRLDASFAANARLAAQYEQRQPSPTRGNNKVMTPAQFERYRKQQELTRTKSDASKSDSSEDGSDNYDDEDETERNRQAAKQRKKQEAHLAVYRQQMMKVTGEQAEDLPNIGQPTGSLSTPNLPSSRLSTLGFGNEKGIDGGKQSDDEDEDIPLGILAAHGFPNKNRPPTRMSTAGSAANLKVPSQVGVGSVMGESTAPGSRNSLPVFARGLPQDPYYGAGLVNPANRESLAMNGGVPVGQAGPPPGPPPGGLIGVIAGEERARAIRRGSPNAQGGYEPPMHPGTQRSQTMGNLGPMGMTGMPGMPLSPGDQAQIQMSQQMTQMMQMQMQWMQQMQQMVQMGGMPPSQMPPQMSQPPPGMNGLLAPPGQIQRPMSMVSNSAPGSPMAQHDQRTLSMLDPSLSQWNRTSTLAPSINGLQGGQRYAPSIAPSERSNVGMASRYRPVSTMVPPSNKNMATRASTFNSTTLQGWDNYQRQPQSQSTSTIKAVNSKADKAGSDDDDDEGWAEMKKKADKKRSTWKMRKGQHALQDIFQVGS